jgi:DNA-binding GntR family transcriptional regulator
MTQNGTRGEGAFVDLRADILAGRLLPGQRLQFGDLNTRYGTSVGVLREALSRLAEQGLVTSEPQHGFRVTPVSPDDLRDLTDARVEIETVALRRSLTEGTIAWESALVAAHHTLDRTPQVADDDPHRVSEEWTNAHDAFHRALLQGCPNRRIREMAASLRDASELYRRWSRHLGQEDDRDIPGEHERLLKAAITRDVDTAVGLLTQHIQFSTNAILAAGTLPPDLDLVLERKARAPRKKAAAAAGKKRKAASA